MSPPSAAPAATSAAPRDRPTVAVINAVLANGGDAAILLGLRRALEAACGPLRLVVFDGQADVTARDYPELDVRPALHAHAWPARAPGLAARLRRGARWLRLRRRLPEAARRLAAGDRAGARRLAGAAWPALEALAAADARVSTGGTYLTETYWLGPRLLEFAAVRPLGPYALYTQSLGPFARPGVRRALARVFAEARLVLLRDARSERTVRALAPDASARVRADAAFGLAEPAVLARAAARTLPPEGARVVVSVREWGHFAQETPEEGMARYRAAVSAAVVHLVRRRRARVTFLSTCQGRAGYRYDDARVAAAIAAGLPEDVRAAVRVDGAPRTPAALLDAFGRADLVLATRMHAAILALAAGTPALPVAYEFKTRELFGTLGAADWVQDIETVAPETLVAAAEQVWTELPARRAALFAAVAAQRADALEAGRDTARALGLPLREGGAPAREGGGEG